MTERLIRVLIVDDSAVIRGLLQRALAQPGINVVGAARDGTEALQAIARLKPDVVTLDVEMPRLNGIGVLERVVGKAPVAFVMVSTLTQAGAQVTFEALRKGAFDYVTKPEATRVSRAEFEKKILAKVRSAASSQGRRVRAVGPSTRSAAPTLPPSNVRGWVVGIGISCGGPQTLTHMLPAFPSNFVPILVTQHMPPQFTRSFADQLDRACAMRVVEAADGQDVRDGCIYVAPGSHHLRVRRSGAGLRIQLDEGPKVSGHRPSADVMFQSLASVMPTRTVGVLMTGMGSDGAAGLLQLRRAGARTVAQDEATSLVYGMPKAAADCGAAEHVLPLDQLPASIARLMQRIEPASAARGM